MITPKQFEQHSMTKERWGTQITFTTGKLAPHCDGAVEITMWETKLLVTAVMEKNPDPNKGWFPLSIDYRESYYAAGKIGWGRYRKREGRPSDESILYARLTDRPMRPMFPKGMVNDVIITISPLSLDQKHSPGEVSIIGASVATLLAGIPFAWPIAGVRIWYIDGEFVINMTDSQAEQSILDLHVAGTKNTINMLEAWGNEAPITLVKEWLILAQQAIKELCEFQEAFIKDLHIAPLEIMKNLPDPAMLSTIETYLTSDKLATLHGNVEKNIREGHYNTYQQACKDIFAQQNEAETHDWNLDHVRDAFFTVVKKWIRKKTIHEGIRIDGRWLDDIRQIYCEVDTVPRAHGTWFFWRGDTQVLSLLTLGSPGDAELKDGMEHDQEAMRYMHHYKMPPFSNNEARMIRGTNRREVGHGRLAEKALEPMLPDEVHFPYTMRIVSEVLGSWWSTSMASVCGSTLALMAWWVPIKKPVSGIAMWLMIEGDTSAVLTDIKGTEDFTWDMDFKLAGTDEWMTAIQMDTKLQGVNVSVLQDMVDKAQTWRTAILAFMKQTLAEARSEMSPYAPYLLSFKVAPEEVKIIIGKGGSTIQEIVRETWVKIDLEDDGSWVIAAENKAAADEAKAWIDKLLWKPSVGDELQGTITRVEKYGVFVNIWGGTIGLCHVKQLGEGYIADVSAVYKIDQAITVKVIDIDAQGKIALKKIG